MRCCRSAAASKTKASTTFFETDGIRVLRQDVRILKSIAAGNGAKLMLPSWAL